MKPADVTDEMVERVRDSVDLGDDSESSPKEIIAASVNAYLGDPTPITAELLVARGWTKHGDTLEKRVSDDQYMFWDGFDMYIDDEGDDIVELPSVKTIGQLRALEIGLGIEPCQ